MQFDALFTKMVGIGQLNTKVSWGSHRRALAFALVGLISFSTLLWFARGLGYDLSMQTAFQSESSETFHSADEFGSPHAAVVIETSETINLIPLILHFSNLLGPSWPVILFTLKKNWQLPPSHAFRRALQEGRVLVKYLPRNTEMSTNQAVSTFLTSTWLWEQLESLDRVLLFQTDSVLCSRAAGSVDDFLQWDFVGAPIGGQIPSWSGRGYNGGLSLRNPKLFLEIAREGGFNPYNEHPKNLRYEDQWFYQRLMDRNDTRLPTIEEAKEFSVETIYYERPLGYHQPQRWQSAHMDQIESYCPEVNMILKRRIYDTSEPGQH